MKLFSILVAVMLFGCAGTKDVLAMVAPLAAEQLRQLILSHGGETDRETAWCIELTDPEVSKITEITGEVYVLCGAEPL